ncbi:hypothetical protein C7M84_015623 [Penaeus vannamei]|uniref:Uncharacterized protein n=1 Tax=Penaeus vannamei TaxID=6689 RepID=A0A3R7M3P0_PENVA|nr:hypothetical protein C7M84_015623 [Penaeus vannamei]
MVERSSTCLAAPPSAPVSLVLHVRQLTISAPKWLNAIHELREVWWTLSSRDKLVGQPGKRRGLGSLSSATGEHNKVRRVVHPMPVTRSRVIRVAIYGNSAHPSSHVPSLPILPNQYMQTRLSDACTTVDLPFYISPSPLPLSLLSPPSLLPPIASPFHYVLCHSFPFFLSLSLLHLAFLFLSLISFPFFAVLSLSLLFFSLFAFLLSVFLLRLSSFLLSPHSVLSPVLLLAFTPFLPFAFFLSFGFPFFFPSFLFSLSSLPSSRLHFAFPSPFTSLSTSYTRCTSYISFSRFSYLIFLFPSLFPAFLFTASSKQVPHVLLFLFTQFPPSATIFLPVPSSPFSFHFSFIASHLNFFLSASPVCAHISSTFFPLP